MGGFAPTPPLKQHFSCIINLAAQIRENRKGHVSVTGNFGSLARVLIIHQHFFVIVWFIVLLVLFFFIYLESVLSETPVRTKGSQTLHNAAIDQGLHQAATQGYSGQEWLQSFLQHLWEASWEITASFPILQEVHTWSVCITALILHFLQHRAACREELASCLWLSVTTTLSLFSAKSTWQVSSLLLACFIEDPTRDWQTSPTPIHFPLVS